MLFIGTHHHIRYILARCEDIHAKGDFSIIGSAIWDVNFTAITQSFTRVVEDGELSNTMVIG